MDSKSPDAQRGVGVGWRSMSTVAMVTSLGGLAASIADLPAGARFGLLLAFMCTGPGTALLGSLEPSASRLSAVAVLGTGLALGALAAQLLLWLHAWAPGVATSVGAVVCLLVLARLNRARRLHERGAARWWQVL